MPANPGGLNQSGFVGGFGGYGGRSIQPMSRGILERMKKEDPATFGNWQYDPYLDYDITKPSGPYGGPPTMNYGQIAGWTPPNPPHGVGGSLGAGAGGASPMAFTQSAPTPTPYGDFVGLDPATFARTPGSQYLQDQQQKAIQRSAAARGTLLTGGLLKGLQANAEGLAAQDFENAFNRQLAGYTTNRATNAQNFGQQMASYGGGLDAFRANTDAALRSRGLDIEEKYGNYDRAYQASKDQQKYQQSQMDARQQGANASYLAALESVRQQNADAERAAAQRAEQANAQRMRSPRLGGFR